MPTRLPIDLRLWAIVASFGFLVLLVLDVAGVFGDAPGSLRTNLAMWLTGAVQWSGVQDRVWSRVVVFGGISAIAGWPAHCFAILCGFWTVSPSSRDNSLSYKEPADAAIEPSEPWSEQVIRLAALRQEGKLLRRGRGG